MSSTLSLPGAPSASQPMLLCAEDDIVAMLAAVRSAAQAAGCLHVSHMPVPHGQCVVLFIPVADMRSMRRSPAPALIADELISDLELALKHLHSPLALKGNALTRRLNLTLHRHAGDPTRYGDGLALKRAIRAGVDALTVTPRSKDHELAAYFDLRYERSASNADVQRELFVSERTAQRLNKTLIRRLAEVICDMQSTSSVRAGGQSVEDPNDAI